MKRMTKRVIPHSLLFMVIVLIGVLTLIKLGLISVSIGLISGSVLTISAFILNVGFSVIGTIKQTKILSKKG